jgi:hypothetical protein
VTSRLRLTGRGPQRQGRTCLAAAWQRGPARRPEPGTRGSASWTGREARSWWLTGSPQPLTARRSGSQARRGECARSPADPKRWQGRRAAGVTGCRTSSPARREPAVWATRLPSRSVAVCAFSLTSRITQRDGTTGRGAPGSRTLLYPGWPGDRTGRLHRDVHGRPAACQNPGLLDDPGLASPPGPGSPGARRPPAGSPAIPEPGPRGRRHPGIPAGLPFTPRAMYLDQLHRQEDGPRAAGTTDGGRQRTTAIREDPVRGQMRMSTPAWRCINMRPRTACRAVVETAMKLTRRRAL